MSDRFDGVDYGCVHRWWDVQRLEFIDQYRSPGRGHLPESGGANFSVNISIINFLKSETITNLNWSGMIDIAVLRRITFLKTWNKLQNIFPKLPDKSQKHFLSWRNYNLKEKGLYQKFPKIPQKWLVLSIACKNITIYMYIQYIKNRKQRWISDCKNESILKMFGTELKFHKY